MRNIMIDLETLGTGVDAVFISIGAVYFDPETGELGDEFYVNVDWQSSLDAGRKIDADTIKWWFKQSDEARNSVLNKEGVSIGVALGRLKQFCKDHEDNKNIVVWGNGSSFDISILEHAYGRYKAPWYYYNVRDVRTVRDLGADLVDSDIFNIEGTAHNALDDAKHQAKYTSTMMMEIKRNYEKI